MMLKLKLQYFDHLLQRADSFQKTLMLGKIEGRWRRGRQRMRWLNGITGLMDMSLSKLRSWWWTGKHGVLQSMGLQSQTWLSDFTFTFHFHALEKEMATHSSVLAWRIPGMGSLVGCRLWGCTESGHDWRDLTATTAMPWLLWFFEVIIFTPNLSAL